MKTNEDGRGGVSPLARGTTGSVVDITERTFRFAVQVVAFCRPLLSRSGPGRAIGHQLLRSGMSVGANVEEAQAAQTKRVFIAKMSIAQKESRETLYWLRLAIAAALVDDVETEKMRSEADQITRILSKIIANAKRNSAQNEAAP